MDGSRRLFALPLPLSLSLPPTTPLRRYIFHRTLRAASKADVEFHGLALLVTTSSIHCFDASAPAWGDGIPLLGAQCQVELEALVTQSGAGSATTTPVLSPTTRRASAASGKHDEMRAPHGAALGVDLRRFIPEGTQIALMSDEGRLLAAGKGGALAVDAVQPSAATRWRVAWQESEGKWWLALQSVASGAYVRCHGGRVDCPHGGVFLFTVTF